MKKIEAVVRVEKLDAVIEALKGFGAPGMMITRIEGHGRQQGIVEQFRGRQFKVDLLPKLKIEVVVPDESVAKFSDAIVAAARTGEVGDGKIFVSPVEGVVRIRTGAAGEGAV